MSPRAKPSHAPTYESSGQDTVWLQNIITTFSGCERRAGLRAANSPTLPLPAFSLMIPPIAMVSPSFILIVLSASRLAVMGMSRLRPVKPVTLLTTGCTLRMMSSPGTVYRD